MKMPQSNRLSALGTILLFAAFVLLIAIRAELVDRAAGNAIACAGCLTSSVVIADLVMFSLLAGLLLLAGLIRPGWLARAVHVFLAILIFVYIVDLLVYRLFHTRLFLSDLTLFIYEPHSVWDQFASGMGGALTVIAVLAGMLFVLVLLLLMPPVRSRTQRLLLAGLLVLSFGSGSVLEANPYVNNWAVANVFSANLNTSERVHYSRAEGDRLMAATRPVMIVKTGVSEAAAGRPNVVFVILESWSSWHSKLFGGYQDWTPNLDAAARTGLRFTNFHSIGFSTDKGLVGLVAGQQIWASFLHWFKTPPFHSMWGVGRSLPSVFRDRGYLTAFLTSGPLDLYKKGEWLTDLGFEYTEGNEHPFYAELPRFAFGAASDEALYERASQWQRTANQPYFLILETVTTHQPYIDPGSGKKSLELAMKYADRAFQAYLQELRDSGFFASGILVVASDHRSMTPIPAQEIEAFGPAVHSGIPAFIIGHDFGPGGVDTNVYSQADLTPTFELWLSGSTDLMAHQAIMFGLPESEKGRLREELPNCAFHSRGDRRSVIEVLCTSGHGEVLLDGDASRFISSEGLTPQEEEDVLATLACLRIEGLQRQEAMEGEIEFTPRNIFR